MSFQLTKESVSDIQCDAVVNFVSPAELAETSFRVSEMVELAGPGLINHFSFCKPDHEAAGFFHRQNAHQPGVRHLFRHSCR